MRLYTDRSDSAFNKDSYIEFLYTLKGDDYMLDFDINFVGMESYIDRGTNYLDLSMEYRNSTAWKKAGTDSMVQLYIISFLKMKWTI